MTYKCNDCGATFDEPAEIYETHGFDHPPYEKWAVCPRCKNNDFEEVAE